ncbi:MAG: hypothetical protein LBL93_01220 [Ruminococcus sp.]|jgi:hypothetical protein|nr:hypothetical protein [Ruminococcus sp.]
MQKIKYKNKNLKNKKLRTKKFKSTKIKPGIKLRNILSWCITGFIALTLVFLGYSAVGPAILQLSRGSSDTDKINLPSQTDSSGEIYSDANSVSVYTIKNLSSFQTELADISRSNYDTVIVPLKEKGGTINYKTSFEPAYIAGAVPDNIISSDINIAAVVDILKENGFVPVAMLSTLDDEIYPLKFGDTKYSLVNPSGDSSGGLTERLYLNPKSAGTVSYIKALSVEIQNAGFEKIICTDVALPGFTESDIDDFINNISDNLNIEIEVN